MKNFGKNIVVILMVFLLVGCGNETNRIPTTESQPSLTIKSIEAQKEQTIEQSTSPLPISTEQVQEHLFEAKFIETIELTGQEILEGAEADMSVMIADNVKMDFHISRDNPNGTKLYAIYNSEAINFAVNYICSDVFDEQGEAIPDYKYQISCYDFNNDGVKEVVVACGNKKDKLSLFVFDTRIESEGLFSSLNYILGYTTATVNDSNEICIASPNGVKTYKYNIKAYDAEYAKLTGPLKISVDYLSQEQLTKYESANKFVIQEEGADILILPKEPLKDFRISYVEYDGENDKFNESKDLYIIPEITPDKPLILKFSMPTIPSIKISYIEASGIEQSCIIAESGFDGSIFLIEQGSN